MAEGILMAELLLRFSAEKKSGHTVAMQCHANSRRSLHPEREGGREERKGSH